MPAWGKESVGLGTPGQVTQDRPGSGAQNSVPSRQHRQAEVGKKSPMRGQEEQTKATATERAHFTSGHTFLRTSFPTHVAQHIGGPWPQRCPPLPTPSPHRLLSGAFPQPALPPPLPAHRAISLPSFQYFLLVVLLRTKSRGDSTALYFTSSFLTLAWPDRALIKASSRASAPAASGGS